MKSNRLVSRLSRSTARLCQAGQIMAVGLALVTGSAVGGQPFSRIFTFGDSLTDTGNFFELTGGAVPPAGLYADGRVSNGPIWIEYLADELGLALQDADQFATLGSMTGETNFRDVPGVFAFPGFQDQVDSFFARHGAEADPDALYVVWIGANDVFAWLRDSGGNPSLVPALIGNGVFRTVSAVARLAEAGARHIMVANLPDLGLTPDIKAFGPAVAAALTQVTDLYNGALAAQLDLLADGGVPTIRVDAARIIRDIVGDPAAFGIDNVSVPAILTLIQPALFGHLDPDASLFWDGVHPTTVGHAVIAGYAVDALVSARSPRRGLGDGPGLVHALNGLVNASTRR